MPVQEYVPQSNNISTLEPSGPITGRLEHPKPEKAEENNLTKSFMIQSLKE